MAKILIIENDITFSHILEGLLKNQGYEVELVPLVKAGIQALARQTHQLVLLNYRLPDGTGFELLEANRTSSHPIPVIMMTSFREVGAAVRAMRLGAFDYITKPVNPAELLMVVQEALQKKLAPAVVKEAQAPDQIFGQSEASQQLYNFIALVAPTDMSVIIQGESGTGKEYAARTIHRLSKRAAAPFVAIDCGALSGELANSELFGHVKGAFTGALHDKQGLFEAAQGGTVFLDEVGNLGYEVQVKLLRALQERVIQPLGSYKQTSIDVRVITATNEDLITSVKNNLFREDLYHRLNEFKINVPALRDRHQDLPTFVQHFTRLANQELGRQVDSFSPEAMAIFKAYNWPGNLRELRNVVRRAVLLTPGPVAAPDTLPDEMVTMQEPPKPEGPDLKAHQEATERALILKTLQEVKYNKSKAARLLNIDRKTLYLKLAKYNIPA